MTPAEAASELDRIKGMFLFLPETSDSYPAWEALVLNNAYDRNNTGIHQNGKKLQDIEAAENTPGEQRELESNNAIRPAVAERTADINQIISK